MSDYTLNIPDDIYTRARQIADVTAQPVDRVMIDYLRTLSAPTLPPLSPDEEAELTALQQLSDDALWTIAREQMPAELQDQMQDLMDKNSLGTISADEFSELEKLVECGQRLMVRKSEAMALLTERGYSVTPQEIGNQNIDATY